ncbi:MAG: cbb3-type cytochrome c oxidase subunit I [Chrysiogenetes bacterium]|nr:cbb3-type cytochrome c oxidase subunit I [Chrysiogenetes bacterium]
MSEQANTLDTRTVVRWHFIVAILLFQLQVVFGLLSVAHYVFGDFFYNHLFDFHVTRTYHTNLLIVWLIIGFMGATYHLIADEGQTEVKWPKLALINLGLFVAGGVAGLIGYLFRYWQGREFVELPPYLDVAVVAVVGIFLANVIATFMAGKRRTGVQIVMLIGFVLTGALYIPANLHFDNEALQSYYWWWTVHLWVEGVWELIMGSMLAFLMIKMTGVDREIIEKWLYVVISFTLFTGVLGIGHHYYWIGTPRYWLVVGGLFSAMEPLAFLGMVLYAVYAKNRATAEHPNKMAMLWAISCTIMATIGVLHGMAQTLPVVNQYTHGTHVTASHGHLAFYGAYAMINLAFFTYMLPISNKVEMEDWNQGLNKFSFYAMLIGMLGITTASAIAGITQTVFERLLGRPYPLVQEMETIVTAYQLWMFFGFVFLAGSVAFAVNFFKPGLKFLEEDEALNLGTAEGTSGA